VEANAKMRIGGKPARHAQRESNLLAMQTPPRNGSEPDIIDFRIGAPGPATGDGNFELAGKIVELRVAAKLSVQLQSQRRGVAEFVRVETRQRAASDVARNVAARAGGR